MRVVHSNRVRTTLLVVLVLSETRNVTILSKLSNLFLVIPFVETAPSTFGF